MSSTTAPDPERLESSPPEAEPNATPYGVHIALPGPERAALAFALGLATADCSPTVGSVLWQYAMLTMRGGVTAGLLTPLSTAELDELVTVLIGHPLRAGQIERVCTAIERCTGERPSAVRVDGALALLAATVSIRHCQLTMFGRRGEVTL